MPVKRIYSKCLTSFSDKTQLSVIGHNGHGIVKRMAGH